MHGCLNIREYEHKLVCIVNIGERRVSVHITSGSLGERKIFWEHELGGQVFPHFEFFQTFTSVSITL
jgi:hypothetical protein